MALADLIGLDVLLAVMQTIHDEFCDSKYRPCPLLKEMVAAGYLGRKTGRGRLSLLNCACRGSPQLTEINHASLGHGAMAMHINV